MSKIKRARAIVAVFLILAALAFVFTSVSSAVSYAETLTSAKAAALVEVSSGRVLFEQNSDARLPMASTTKIMTALVVLDKASLDEVVQVDDAAIGVEGSSLYLKKGEKLTVRELLYGLMLRSGNDCAVALALHVGGSVERFAEYMNEKAAELGLTNSHFCNPHGLHNEKHFTSALDLAKITCSALKNDDFAKIVATQSITISDGFGNQTRHIANKNKLLKNFDFADGVKTGFTKKAGRCFVGSATENGMKLVAVVLNCGPMFEDAEKMLTFGFDNFRMQTVLAEKQLVGALYKTGNTSYFFTPSNFAYPISTNGDENDSLTKTVDIDPTTNTAQITVKFGAETVYFKQVAAQ